MAKWHSNYPSLTSDAPPEASGELGRTSKIAGSVYASTAAILLIWGFVWRQMGATESLRDLVGWSTFTVCLVSLGVVFRKMKQGLVYWLNARPRDADHGAPFWVVSLVVSGSNMLQSSIVFAMSFSVTNDRAIPLFAWLILPLSGILSTWGFGMVLAVCRPERKGEERDAYRR